MAGQDPAAVLVRHIKTSFWLRDIDRTDARQRKGARYRRKRPNRTLLGAERAGKDRGVIQGRSRQAWPKPNGFCFVHDVVPGHGQAPSAYACWKQAEYSLAESMCDAPGKADARRAIEDCAPKTAELLKAVLHRATVAAEVRRIKTHFRAR